MPSNYDKLLRVGDKANFRHNSEAAIYTFGNPLQSEDIKVIFERHLEYVTMSGEMEVISTRPVAWLQHDILEDLGFPLPIRGNQLEIQGEVFDILEVLNDGHNQSECHLELE